MAASKGAMTKIYTYTRALKSETDYARKMKRLSCQIFGEARRPHTPSTAALEAQMAREPKEQAERWICYYPAHEEAAELFTSLRDHGLYRDEYKDFCEEMQRLRALRGKVKERPSWKDGQPPEKVVKPRYDGQNSYNTDFL